MCIVSATFPCLSRRAGDALYTYLYRPTNSACRSEDVGDDRDVHANQAKSFVIIGKLARVKRAKKFCIADLYILPRDLGLDGNYDHELSNLQVF